MSVDFLLLDEKVRMDLHARNPAPKYKSQQPNFVNDLPTLLKQATRYAHKVFEETLKLNTYGDDLARRI
ncbi:hypothetical protein ACS0TY_018144 [Phlomoides rotata]